MLVASGCPVLINCDQSNHSDYGLPWGRSERTALSRRNIFNYFNYFGENLHCWELSNCAQLHDSESGRIETLARRDCCCSFPTAFVEDTMWIAKHLKLSHAY